MQNSIHFQLMIAENSMHREIVAGAAKQQLYPGQPKILEYLSEHDGCLQQELAKNCELNKSTITGLVKRMEEKHLIRRKVSTTDARSVAVYLTPEGKAAAEEMERIFENVESRALQGVSEEEKVILKKVLKQIRMNLLDTTGGMRHEI